VTLSALDSQISHQVDADDLCQKRYKSGIETNSMILTHRMALLCCLIVIAASRWSHAAQPPNVVLIVSDDQGYNDLGVLLPELKTPALDRLAREGVRLTSFYVAWPACTPSRAALLTGRYPQRNGIYDMIRNEAPDYGYKYKPAEYEVSFERIGGMDTREVILPAYLKQVGYTSGIFGKWDLGSLERFLPLQKGFDDFYGFVNTGIDFYTHERYGVPSMYRNNKPTQEDKGTYCTWLFEREALRFLDENHHRPFFLYLPFNAPHGASGLEPHVRSGTQAPKEYRDMYPLEGPRFERGAIKKYSPTSPYAGQSRRKTRAARVQEYRGCVTAMDKSIGSVLDFLDEKKLSENTIVIFFSDNGGSGGADNRPLRGKKGDTWEGGIRVPCLVRWPGVIPAGTVTHEFLTSLEVVPTLASACGFSVPQATTLDGFDMLPVLQGQANSPRQSMYWKRRDSLGARVGHWKYVKMKGREYLFDLSKDLGEKVDLSESNPDQFRVVKAAFTGWLDEMEASEPRGPFRNF
jgi:arylsulfatase A-like enzyme